MSVNQSLFGQRSNRSNQINVYVFICVLRREGVQRLQSKYHGSIISFMFPCVILQKRSLTSGICTLNSI